MGSSGWRCWSLGVLASGAIGWAGGSPAQAAEQVTLRFGPFEQVVSVAEVEAYAKTGKLSPSLQFFSVVLTPETRKALNTKLDLDPKVSSQVVGDLLKSPAGQQLMQNLQSAAPGLTVEAIQAGVTIAAKQFGGLDAIGVLKAIPQKNITIDLSEAAALGSKLNLTYWQSQATSTLLQRSLAVEKTNFSASFDPSLPGKGTVSQQTIVLTDSRRQRSLPVNLYLPETVQGPIVVISPGFESSKQFLTYVAQHLASHGFSVVAIDHPSVFQNQTRPTLNPEKLLPPQELLDRPKDVSFVLDELAKRTELSGKVNAQKAIVMGHSLGGYGALALAGGEIQLDELRQFCQKSKIIQRTPADWLQCSGTELAGNRINLRDSRVVGTIALNPAVGKIFGKSGLSQVKTPTVMLASTDDSLTPPLTQQLQPFMQLPTPKYLMTAIGATHLSVSDRERFQVGAAARTLVKEKVGAEVDPLRRAVLGVSLAFVKQQTPEAEKYKPFLSAGYVQSIATAGMPLRMNSELPTGVTRLLKLAGMV